VQNNLKTLSTGRHGTSVAITRNSYSIDIGRGGCANADWICAKDSVAQVRTQVEGYMRDYPGTWNFEANRFRTDMCENLIVRITGTQFPNQIVVAGAHLDSRNTGSGPTSTGIAPGADDNGSGSAVLLEMIRVIGTNKVLFQYTLDITFFCGEEQGLIGSAALARSTQRYPVGSIVGMFNADMIGYTQNGNVVLAFMSRSSTLWLTDSCKEISRTYQPALAVGSTTGCCSDQQSYFSAGHPALGIFETPTAAVVYPEYHRTGDQWDNGLINHNQVHLFGRSVFACILEYGVVVV